MIDKVLKGDLRVTFFTFGYMHHAHLLIKVIRMVFGPIFKQDEIPFLNVFYPSPNWFKEQQLATSFSTEKKKLNVPFGVPFKSLASMIFVEFRPGKIISGSFLFLFALMISRPLLPSDSYFGLFCFAFICLLLSTSFGANNLSDGFDYLVYEYRNRYIIKKLYNTHSHYDSFIAAYNAKSHFKLNVRLLSFLGGMAWLLMLASIIVLGVIAWRW